jgi:hypothetical protein
MISFDSFDVSQIASAFVLTVPQRYLHSDVYDLSAEKKTENRSDIIPTTLPVFSEKERILLTRDGLLERRAQIYDCWFLSFRKSKIAEIRLIDKQIDLLENQLISMQKIERENMIANTKKIMSDADALLHRIKG